MNRSLVAVCMLPAALLTGCGSSSSSSSPDIAPRYQWQVVQLKSMLATEVANTCVIYADSTVNNDEVITAYVAESDFNILYHHADGSIATLIAADETQLGAYQINSADVPDGGYVSLEEISVARGGDTGSYMFSVQKSLLSDMVLNIAQEQTGDCYAGVDHRVTTSAAAFVNVREPATSPAYYQSSFDQNSINGSVRTSDIPVDTPYPASRDVLITAFDDHDAENDQKTALSHWGFVPAANVFQLDTDPGYGVTNDLQTEALIDVYWSTNNDLTLNRDSGVIATHAGNHYFWQPIYVESDTLTVAYDTEQISQWNAYFSGVGSNDVWSFNSFNALTDERDISLATLPALSAVDGINVSASCTISSAFCLDTDNSFDSEDFDLQRTHLRLAEQEGDINNIVYQSTYTSATAQPIILQSSVIEFFDPTLTRIELNLMRTDAAEVSALQYLMSENMDLVSVGEYGSNPNDDAAETALFNDINGFISSDSEMLYSTMLGSNSTTVMSSHQDQ